MAVPLFALDDDSALSLQQQIRQQLLEAVLAGALPPGARLPSSRQLARQLGVARNTVFLAYQQLIADGQVQSRERSGLYVSTDANSTRVGLDRLHEHQEHSGDCDWAPRLKRVLRDDDTGRATPHWRQYPFPLLDGLFDDSLFPAADWREASRLALGTHQIQQWSTDSGDADDPLLMEELRLRVLLGRGIVARPEELLLTMGARQALDLVTQLLIDRGTRVAVEDPGNPELRRLVSWRGGQAVPQPVDSSGLVVTPALDDCAFAIVSPGCQHPTGAVLPTERRRALLERAAAADFVLVEDATSTDALRLPSLPATLWSLDRAGRVIHVTTLSRVLEPGLQLGLIIAPPAVIRELRKLRRIAVHHPPRNIQQAAAYFLSLGHHDRLQAKLAKVFSERQLALRDALNHYLHAWVEIRPAPSGTAFWIQGPDDLDVAALTRAAERRGVLIDPVQQCYAVGDGPPNAFRLGFTSLPAIRIRAGIAALAGAVRDTAAGGLERLPLSMRGVLGGERLRSALRGLTLLYKTVYGDPCTIELLPDGRMAGRAGYANEDCDAGRWWTEGDRWYRQWDRWAYGEPSSFHTVVEADRVKWFNSDGVLVDSAVISRQG